MREVAACGLMVLVFDAVLCAALWAALLLLQCCGCGGLAGVWAFAAVKWVVLHVFTSKLTDGRPQAELRRLAALLCLMSPVFESGRVLASPPSQPYLGPSPELNVLILGPMAASLACVVWEKGFCGDARTRTRTDGADVDAGKLLMRLLKYFKADTIYLLAAFTFLILGVICDTLIPLYQGSVIDMLRAETLHSSFLWQISLLTLFSLGSAVFSGCRGGIFMCTLARLNRRLKNLLFHRLLQQDVPFFEKNQPGSLSSRLHSDVDRMGRTVALNANALVRSTVKSFLMLAVMIHLSWQLTLLTCIEMPLLGILQKKYSTLSTEFKDQMQESLAQNNNLAMQTVKGIRTVRSFRAEDVELRRYGEALECMCAIKRRSGIYSAIFLLLRRLLTLGIKILMLVQARSLISSGDLSIGSLVSFFLYQKPMSNNLRELLYCCGDTMSTVKVISKVFGHLDRTPQVKPAGDLAPKRLEGKVVFQNVTFAYPAAPEKPALKSVSMELQPGKMTALVGPSGSGKTSCVSLLKRLYEPQEGQILLDGEPLHRYKHKYLHQKVASVSQNPVLFSGSLRYNIGYGLRDCADKKVEEAARKANADEFISNLEHKYDTDMGECGGILSDGWKQCIAIIRALVRDPQVLILDEATSKLDAEMQRAVLTELRRSRGLTVLVVAHQLETVRTADHIVFIEDGRVVEEGTHQELMLLGERGRYYRWTEELFV
ncbi:antigen peptide transporter 2 isoform 1-T1 [Symphorus nematophorus]